MTRWEDRFAGVLNRVESIGDMMGQGTQVLKELKEGKESKGMFCAFYYVSNTKKESTCTISPEINDISLTEAVAFQVVLRKWRIVRLRLVTAEHNSQRPLSPQ